MSFADSSKRSVEAGVPETQVVLAAACEVGDLLAYSSGWKLADSDLYAAQFVAMDKGAVGDYVNVCRECIVKGPSGMTPGNSYYLSDTAGGYKDSSGTVVQVVGMAIDATHLLVRLTQNRSMTAGDIDTDAVGSAEIAAGAVDSAEILAGAVDEAHLAVGGASAGLSGLVCKFVADANVIGGIPVIHRIAIGDATANTDVVLTHKTHICKIWYVKSTTAGGSSDKVRAISGTSTNYITEDFAVGGTANAIVTPTTLISTYCEIAAGGTLRFSATKASNVACVAYVLGFRVA